MFPAPARQQPAAGTVFSIAVGDQLGSYEGDQSDRKEDLVAFDAASLQPAVQLGALQVARNGDLANWSVGGPDAIPAVGGAMDLVAGVKSIYVMTQHCTKQGEPKLVERCTYPLTGLGVVNRIYTDLAVIDVTPGGFRVVELSPGVELEYVQERTGTDLIPPQ